MPIKNIETEYNGLKFRSKLEAMHAKFFDKHGIKWIYEPHIIEYSEGEYLPDFYFPEIKCYFEVKGDGVPGFGKALKAVSENSPKEDSEDFQPCVVIGDGSSLFGWFPEDPPQIVKCDECGKIYFIEEAGSWQCPVCKRTGDDYKNINYSTTSLRQDWKHR